MERLKQTLKKAYCQPEQRRWRRLIDSGYAAFGTVSALLTLYIVNLQQSPTVAHPTIVNVTATLLAITTLAIAWLLYRPSGLLRLERSCLVLLVLTSSVAVLLAAL